MQRGTESKKGGGGRMREEKQNNNNNSRNSVNKFLLFVYLNVHHAIVTEGMLWFPDLNPTVSCGFLVRTSSGGNSPRNTPVMFLRAKERTNQRGSCTHGREETL